jgi:FAD/FMN-containing dehydrogenase
MATVSDAAVKELASGFSGELVRPGDPTYDEVRKIFNGMIDRKPALIARARTTADLAATVRLAAKEGMPLAVRGGGHSIAGFSMIDGAIVADCSLMNEVAVDPKAATITAGPGCRWRDVDSTAGAHGLATTGGTISSTGIGGFTLGGGLGFLAKKYGLACDNLIDAEVVLASGDVVRANANENTDLFWAIRGGGGNFGIVSSFTYQAHPVNDITFSLFMWPAADGLDHLKFYRDYFPSTPPEVVAIAMFGTAPPLPFIPENLHGTAAFLMGAIYLGPQDEAEPWLKPIADRSPAASATIPMPYMFAQQLLDASAPDGVRNYWRSSFMDEASDEALKVISDSAAKNPSPMSLIQLINVGPSPEVDNAFHGREHAFLYHLISVWMDPADDDANIGWNTTLSQDLAPFSSKGAYLNFIGDEGNARVRNSYGPKYDRLLEIKKKYDPTNMFRYNQNIAP